jgi:ATP-dependent DNA helicase DinG
VARATDPLEYLDRVCASMDGGEVREGQREMVLAISRAISARRHLVVQAGTGTGKSLGYLVPAIAAGRRTIVATATKTLQDQLASRDLPLLAKHLKRPLSWAVLKGRSNYLCLQRLDESEADAQLSLGGLDIADSAEAGDRGGKIPERWAKRFAVFAETSESGDRADLEEEPPAWVWSAVSVGPRECPSAAKCPRGEDCFAERARKIAAEADVVIVNTHLYGLHLGSRGAILPDHDVVVFDEAHEVEDTISATTGLDLGPGSLTSVARIAGGLISAEDLIDAVESAAARFGDLLTEDLGTRFRKGLPAELADLLSQARAKVMELGNAARGIDDRGRPDTATRKARVATAVGALVLDIDAVLAQRSDTVMWVGGTAEHPRLQLAPLDVGITLDELLWNPEPTGLDIVDALPSSPAVTGSEPQDEPGYGLPDTVIFTSATVPPGIVERLGVPADLVDEIDVGTPFDFEAHALLYCAAHMPEPRTAKHTAALHTELERLIRSAQGRTLALFTSYRAMNDAADELTTKLPFTILRQGELPKAALIEKFRAEESSCLFATMGYWAGIDVPGPSLSLVTIDKIPFPRPDDPLLQARRERAGAAGFTTIDLPRAATMLAQGAGRLIRTSEDTGVVAILDPRLATKASYRWALIDALPPMKRTKHFAEVATFLADQRKLEP